MYPGTLFRDILFDTPEQRSGIQKKPFRGESEGQVDQMVFAMLAGEASWLPGDQWQ